MARSTPAENLLYHCSYGQLPITCSEDTEVPNGQLPVAVDHSQLRTMASETVNSINSPLPPTLYRAVPPELQMRDTNQERSKLDRLVHLSVIYNTYSGSYTDGHQKKFGI